MILLPQSKYQKESLVDKHLQIIILFIYQTIVSNK